MTDDSPYLYCNYDSSLNVKIKLRSHDCSLSLLNFTTNMWISTWILQYRCLYFNRFPAKWRHATVNLQIVAADAGAYSHNLQLPLFRGFLALGLAILLPHSPPERRTAADVQTICWTRTPIKGLNWGNLKLFLDGWLFLCGFSLCSFSWYKGLVLCWLVPASESVPVWLNLWRV